MILSELKHAGKPQPFEFKGFGLPASRLPVAPVSCPVYGVEISYLTCFKNLNYNYRLHVKLSLLDFVSQSGSRREDSTSAGVAVLVVSIWLDL